MTINTYKVTIEETENHRWHWSVSVDSSNSSKSGYVGSINDAEIAATKALDGMMRERRPAPTPEIHPLYADEPVTEPPTSEGPRVLRTYTNRG